MIFSHLVFLAGAATAGTPRRDNDNRCGEPSTRVEWRDMSDQARQSYIDAVLCLKTKPSKIGLPTSHYDDFPWVHQEFNLKIHGNANFLPWHRYFGVVYEQALQECGYEGAATYWDWTQDVKKLAASPVMSDELGFGGDGSDEVTETTGDGLRKRCVTSGPFKDLRPSYLAYSPTEVREEEHCLSRQLQDGESDSSVILATVYNSTYIDIVQGETTFETYHGMLESSPHGAIHAALGGEMNPTTSPNEPLFFLHHAQVDRLWSKWQHEDLATREFQYQGQTFTLNSTEMVPASLDDMLPMGGLAEDLTVRDVMSQNARLCYEYAT